MHDQERFGIDRQRRALVELADSVDFLRTDEGIAFMRQLESFLVPRGLATARRLGVGAGWVASEDVVHTIILRLSEKRGRAARYAAAADGEPWIYLAACLTGWMREQIGTRGRAMDEHTVVVDAGPDSEDSLTPISRVVSLTYSALQNYTHPSHRHALRPLLKWLAVNPPQRSSYESVERAAAKVRFPTFTLGQISAVMNIAWGGRPRRRETSLMAAFLLDAGFRPSDSPTHARAIARYRRSMGSHAPSESLLDQIAA